MRSKFVCVRITRMNGVDLNRFEFDYDTTWAAFLLDEQLQVYSRYGGRDAGEPHERLSKQSLLQTMREVLQIHADRRRTGKPATDATDLQPVPLDAQRPEDIPLLKKNHQGCVHCHQIREYRMLQWAHEGQFDRRRLFSFPLPQGLGIHLDRRHGHRIQRVVADSAASRAQLRPGDVIQRLAQVPIHSELDIRWALQRLPNDSAFALTISRRSTDDGAWKSIPITLQPDSNWRITDLSWRKSQRSVPVALGIRGYALTPSQLKQGGFSHNQLAIRVISVYQGLGSSLGLQKRDVIISIGGESGKRTFEQFKADLLRRYQPGDVVRLTVSRESRTIELNAEFPPWHTEKNSVP